MAIHIDGRFLTDSFLHHSGGFLFYIPALLLLGLGIWLLRKGERNKGTRLDGLKGQVRKPTLPERINGCGQR